MLNAINKKGCFITFEGVEGSGKSTLIPLFKDFLATQKFEVTSTREPGGTIIAEKIRELILNSKPGEIANDTELLLFFAARAQHLAQTIKPALAKGEIVLCDRFTDATYAYQGAGRGMDMEKIATLERLVQGDLRPNLVLIFDLDPKVGLTRAGKVREPDCFEVAPLEFFQRVRDFYLNLAVQDPGRYKIIDANLTKEQVLEQVKSVFNNFKR